MSPQFVVAGGCLRREVERITDEYPHIRCRGNCRSIRCKYQPPAKLRRLRYHVNATVRRCRFVHRPHRSRACHRLMIAEVVAVVPGRTAGRSAVEYQPPATLRSLRYHEPTVLNCRCFHHPHRSREYHRLRSPCYIRGNCLSSSAVNISHLPS